MKTMLLIIALFGQIMDTQVGEGYILSIPKEFRPIGDNKFLSDIPTPTPSPQKGGVVRVKSVAAQVNVSASNQQRDKLEVVFISREKVDDEFTFTYFVTGTGKVWIRTTAIDFDKKLFEDNESTIELGPPPKPDPKPDPTPDVPADEFDNIGQRVATWSASLSKKKEVGQVYKDCAAIASLTPSIEKLSQDLAAKRATIVQGDPGWTTFIQQLNKDYDTRKSMFDRTDLINYWKAVHTGLGVK